MKNVNVLARVREFDSSVNVRTVESLQNCFKKDSGEATVLFDLWLKGTIPGQVSELIESMKYHVDVPFGGCVYKMGELEGELVSELSYYNKDERYHNIEFSVTKITLNSGNVCYFCIHDEDYYYNSFIALPESEEELAKLLTTIEDKNFNLSFNIAGEYDSFISEVKEELINTYGFRFK